MKNIIKISLAFVLLILTACSHKKVKIYDKSSCTEIEETGQVACVDE